MRRFNRSLPMTLMKAREAVMREFTPHLREHGLSAQQWRVLRALEEEQTMDATEIANHCALLMPSLSRILQNLEARGLVNREPSENDLRRTLVTIAVDGRALFEVIAPLQEQRYDQITERFGYGKLELLYELLDELIEKVGEEK
jgi:homoprotocatechuate degradation regulator HpaR